MKYFLGNQPETKKEVEVKEAETQEELKSAQTEDTAVEGIKKLPKQHFLYEDNGKRELNAKHYVGNDGTVTAIYSSKAVHYFDEETKELKEVDNSLSDKGEVLETRSNAFKTQFKKRAANGELFEITKGKCRVGLKSHDMAKNCTCETDHCTCEETNTAESKLLFKEVAKGVDVQYIVDSDRVKENIIVKNKSDKYEYDFGMNIENLDVGVSDDGKTLQLKDKETGEVKFYIPAPFMTDASGAYSDLVYYEIAEKSSENLSLKVIADENWINAENRTFPVIIDPQILSPDSSLITCKCYKLVEAQGSNGIEKRWEQIERDSAPLDSKNKLDIIIKKSEIPLKSIVSAKLVVFGPMYAGECFVNGKACFINEFTDIDITDIYKSSYNECKVEFSSSYCSFQLTIKGANAPKLIVEYMENEKEVESKAISLAGGVTGNLNIGTGELVSSFTDINAGNSVLPLQISHIYKKGSGNRFGRNWRLNLHHRLDNHGKTCNQDNCELTENDYVYTDGSGQKHCIKDVYYYVENGVRKEVDKSEVKVESDGSLVYYYPEYESPKKFVVIKEMRTESGLRFVTRLKNIKNLEYFEQRQDEEKQLEESINSYKNYLIDLCLVPIDDGKNIQKINSNINSWESSYYSNSFDDFIKSKYKLLLMTYSEAVQYRSLNVNHDSLNYEYETYKTTKSNNQTDAELVKKKENIGSQVESLKDQIELIRSKDDERREQAIQIYKEYLNKSEQLKQLKRQLPTAYLIDDSGKVLCFNGSGDLCAVVDNYENYIFIQWEKISMGRNSFEVITAVYDGERKTTFKYNYDGQLVSITDPDGNGVFYTYNAGNLTKVNFSNGKILYFTYSSDEIAYVRSNDHILSKIQYNGYIPKNITTYSTVSEITDETQPVSESSMSSVSVSGAKIISDVKITYQSTYVCIDDGTSAEYTLLDKNKKSCGSYVKKNNKVDGLTISSYVDRMFEFSVTPKKTVDMLNSSSSMDETIKQYLGTPPVISSLPDMTSDYSNYGEADWEFVNLDIFNRPTGSETNWRYVGKTAQGKNVYKKISISYTYTPDDPENKCLQKTTTVYTNFNGSKSTSGAECKIYVEKYSYCGHGNLVKTESYVQGEEGTSGITVTERICDDKGNTVKEFTYNTLDSSTRFYTESEYSENGTVLADMDATGENKSSYEYENGKVRQITDPNGSKLAYGYDGSGNVTAITQSTADGEENSTSVKYTLNCPTRLTSGNNVVYYEYDHKRRKTKVTVNGTETVYAYDDDNDITETMFAGHTFTTRKDKDGNVVNTKINNATQLDYFYTDGLLKSVTDSVTNICTQYEYSYDNTYKPTKVSNSDLAETYQYNDHGDLTVRTLTGAVNQAYGYNYKNNAARELNYVALPNGLDCYPKKDVNGRNTGKELKDTYGNKIYCEYVSYLKKGDHGTNIPSAVWYARGNQIKDSIKYKYDKCGNIIEIRENGGLKVRYEYDSLNRLIREDNKVFGHTWLYDYDRNGNILNKRVTNFTLSSSIEQKEFETVEYVYNGDRLMAYDGAALFYNLAGNPVLYRGKSLAWEYGKRLLKFGDTTFAYDGYGRRIKKLNIAYTYDSEGRLIKQTNGTNTLEFIYDTNGINGFKLNGEYYIYRKNVQGDITHILDVCGFIVAEYVYDAWGNYAIIKDTKGLAELNPFRYRSYYYDAETGLYYLQTRYYDPEVGRFLSQDDVTYLDPEHINGLNLYAYCGNNPVMYVDPYGTSVFLALLIGCIIGAVIGFTGSVISQGILNGWDNINWLQAGFDGLIGGITGLIGGSGVGLLGSIVAGGVLGFVGSVGGDLITNGGDFSKVNWGKAVVMSLIGIAIGAIAGAGASNVKVMNAKINAGKSWGAKTFIKFGVSVSDKSATQLARQTAALYYANAILGYKVQAFTYLYAGVIASVVANGLLTKYWG